MNHSIAMRCLAGALLAGFAAAAHAGGDDGPRRTFRESKTYPHIFLPEGYLASVGPVPMRIDHAPPPFSKRLAPPLPEAAKGADRPAPLPVEPKEPEKRAGKGGKKEDLPLPEPDLGKVPDEVLGFFRDKEAHPARRIYLFDPIFQPARSNELPRSKATYNSKP